MKPATTRTNRLVLASLGCLLALSIVVGSACRKEESPAPPPPTPTPNVVEPGVPAPNEAAGQAVEPGPIEPAPVAVTVNGEAVTEAQLQAQIDENFRRNPQMASLPPALLNQLRPALRTQVLDQVIGQILLKQQIEAAGIEVTDGEVLATLEERGAQQNPPLTVEQVRQSAEEEGIGFAQIMDRFRQALALEKLVEPQMAGKTEVTEEEAKAYYDENPTRFDLPETVRASHILLGPTASADPNSDPNKAKAEELLAQIKEGADFAELAGTYSIDLGSKGRGGDLDYFPRGATVPEFEEAAFALEPNEVSDVVETQYGYHIIKATGRQDARTIPFEEAEPQIVQVLERQKQEQVITDYVQSLKEEATIVYPPGSAPPTTNVPSMGVPVPAPNTPPTPAPVITPNDVPTAVEPNTN